MVETPAGCLFEDIQYEDIQVEAVNFQQTEDIRVNSSYLSRLPTGKAGLKLRLGPLTNKIHGWFC